MAQHRVCPWWVGYILASPVRKLWQNPARILGPFVQPGMTVLEPGPGMGFFTLELARLVGPKGPGATAWRSSWRSVATRSLPGLLQMLADCRNARAAGVHDRCMAVYGPRLP